MAHVNAYCRVDNDRRSVSIGGRGANDKVSAWVNLATAGGEFGATLTGECCGSGLRYPERKKKDGDKRRGCWTLELPKPSEHVHVSIETHGAGMRGLAMIGAALCAVKGLQDIAEGNTDTGAKCLAASAETVEMLTEKLSDLPDVTLPTGVSLKRALACVAIVDDIMANGGSPN